MRATQEWVSALVFPGSVPTSPQVDRVGGLSSVEVGLVAAPLEAVWKVVLLFQA